MACYADTVLREIVRAQTAAYNWGPCYSCPHTTCSNKDRRAQASFKA